MSFISMHFPSSPDVPSACATSPTSLASSASLAGANADDAGDAGDVAQAQCFYATVFRTAPRRWNVLESPCGTCRNGLKPCPWGGVSNRERGKEHFLCPTRRLLLADIYIYIYRYIDMLTHCHPPPPPRATFPHLIIYTRPLPCELAWINYSCPHKSQNTPIQLYLQFRDRFSKLNP